MNNVYDNGTILLGTKENIYQYIKNQYEQRINDTIEDEDLTNELYEILKDIEDFENDTIIALNYDSGMGYTFDYWEKEDIVKVGK